MNGRYVLAGVREMASELILKADGSFEYGLMYGAANYYAKGTWKRQNGSVILNTAAKKEPPFALVNSTKRSDPVIRVWVKAPNGQPIPNIRVKLRTEAREMEQNTGQDGSAVFPPDSAAQSVSFEIRVYQFESETFTLNPADNDFSFEIHGEAIQSVAFQNEKVTVEGHDLIMKFWNPDHPMHYERQ